MLPMNAFPSFPLLAKYILNEFAMVLRRLAKAASAMSQAAFKSSGESSFPCTSSTGRLFSLITDESTCGGGKKLFGLTRNLPHASACRRSFTV